MPDRIIRGRCTSSETLQKLSDGGERAWWRLTVCCDDYGRFDADPEILLSSLFKKRPAGWSLARMERTVQEWASGADPLVHLYRVPGDSRLYLHILTTSKHQRDRDSKPKYPDPPCDDLPQLAAKCGESRQIAESGGKSPPNEINELPGLPQLAATCGNSPSGVGSREARAESRLVGGCGNSPQTTLKTSTGSNGLPEWFKTALKESSIFAPLSEGESSFWSAMSQAYDPYEWLKWDEEIAKMTAWIQANPQRKPKALKRFVRNWFERAVEHRRRYATPARKTTVEHSHSRA